MSDFQPNTVTVEGLLDRQGMKWRRYAPDVIPLWVADMDFPVANCVHEALRQLVEKRDYGYALRDGNPPSFAMAKAFARRMDKKFDWSVDPDDVLVIDDLVQTMFACAMAFCAAGEAVILNTPAYPPFAEAVAGTRRRLSATPLRDDGHRYVVDVEALDAAARGARLMFLCNPHNPTGRCFTRAELEQIASIAVRHDLVVVSDEIHSDFVFDGRTHVPFAMVSPDTQARTVTLTSATKSFGFAGLRCGLMHFGSGALRQRFEAAVHPRLLGNPGVMGIDATVAAWTCGDAWLEDVRTYLQGNRDYVVSSLRDIMPEAVLYTPEATYLAWIDFSWLNLPSSAAEFFLTKARVALSDGRAFDASMSSFARLNFATTPLILSQAMGRMRDALKTL